VTGTTFEIKDGDIFDLPLIAREARIFNELAQDAYGKFMSYDDKSVVKSITSVIYNGGKFWVLWNKDEFAGVCLGGIVPNFYNHAEMIANCMFVAVLPQYQRTQWGSKLMKEFEAWAKEKGAKSICYGGYDKKFIRTMKRKGFTQTEVKLMKDI